MVDVEVIDDPAVAACLLDPVRAELLAELTEPASAATLAARVGLTRQKVNYHLNTLQRHHLVSVAEERQWGGLTERVLIASAASYVVSPTALGAVAADPARSNDRLSAGHLIALAARVVREVGELWQSARRTDKRLATLSIDTTIRFRTAAERADFTRDLGAAITTLAARYHDDTAAGGRAHRLFVAAYPTPPTD
ncbi:helix-turn-helix transcriptional regulator [Mycolicibacterium bacteremicum]|uniref:ArsR/SmtB family transcription factor n=1 Tax=Mycolicibacterium bacteremicum TaxID=564198 RepID=UPI0026ED476F|nr:helix-turn-helix domain-containing protein [Mycolicibacterium bacteremicum]